MTIPEAPPPMEGVLEAALYVDDLAEALRFYAETLGLELVGMKEGRHVFFRCGGTIVLLFVPGETETPSQDPAFPVPPHGARGPGHLCFGVDGEQLHAWKARLETAGIPVEADFRWPNGARSIYIRDPAGNSIEFAEPRLWE